MDLNKAMIIGRLTRDPETRTTASGQTVTSFGLATNRIWTDANGQRQERVEYHNIVTWSKLAEICGQYLSKGRKVYIEGRLQTRDWEGQDGVKRYRTEIVAENMIMLEAKGAGAPSASAGAGPEEVPTIEQEAPSEEPSSEENPSAPNKEGDISVEDIPF